MTSKRVFISYSWDDEDHKKWVGRFAKRLDDDGVNVRLDQRHMKVGANIAEFMNREMRHADIVLLVCSPQFREKIHATEEGDRLAGVGWEARLVINRWFADPHNRTIPVLARGSWEEAAPDFLTGTFFIDLSKEQIFEKNYADLLHSINSDDEDKTLPAELGSPELAPALRVGDSSLLFTLHEDEAGVYQTGLKVDSNTTVSSSFELDLTSIDSQSYRDAAAIESDRCTADDIQNLGSELWSKLLGGDVEKAWEAARYECRQRPGAVLKIQLSLSPKFEKLPWEAIFDFDEYSLATSPSATLVRLPEDLSNLNAPVPVGHTGGLLKMLVVIPSGSGLSTSSEWEKIQQVLRTIPDVVELTYLDGRVTLNRLSETLREGWDIFHFIGHGRIEGNRVEVRLNSEEDDGNVDEQWVRAQMFSQQFLRTPPRLVVLNCCHGGATDPSMLGGLGSYLLRAKVQAVVAMRYEVHDSVAADFAAAFYRELLSGERAGRVDLAIQEGRAALARTYPSGDRVRGYITPALYLWKGCEQLFELETLVQETASTGTSIDERIDPRLVDAMRSGACFPIIGQDVLSAGAVRGDNVPAGSVGLTQSLASESGFPDHKRVTPLTESSSVWLTPVVFQRVCQHFESVTAGERRGMIQMIQDTYRDASMPEVLQQIATWSVPGLVYCFIDGLLESAMHAQRGRELRVVQAEDIMESTRLNGDEIVLLNLRGTYSKPQTMILTETDTDRIFDAMPLISRFVEDIMNQDAGCTLLFLGVSPRDALVRALGRYLLRHEVTRRRGTAFFVCNQLTDADRAYWGQFEKIEFVELDELTLIEGLTAAANEEDSRS